jgi:hypothetical protein
MSVKMLVFVLSSIFLQSDSMQNIHDLFSQSKKFLYAHQFPSDCRNTDRSFLIAEDYTVSGFGSGCFFWRACLGLALEQNRILLIPRRTRGGFMHDVSNCSKEDALYVVESSGDPSKIETCRWNPELRASSIWGGRPPKNTLFETLGGFWWYVHSFSFLARPIKSVKSRIQHELSEKGKCAVLQIRRTDKSIEADLFPTKHFVQSLEYVWKTDSGSGLNVTGNRCIRLVTDDPDTVAREVEESLSNPTLSHVYARTKFAHSFHWTEGDGLFITEDLTQMQMGNPLVGTRSSNFGQLGMARKIAFDIETHAPSTLVYVDTGFNIHRHWAVPDSSAPLGIEFVYDEIFRTGVILHHISASGNATASYITGIGRR